MADITIQGDELVCTMHGWDRVFALRSELRIPLRHVRSVTVDPEEAHRFWHGLKVGGTDLRGVITAGTFYTPEGRVFYDVHDASKTVAFELEDESYKKVIVQVDDPETVAAEVRRALQA